MAESNRVVVHLADGKLLKGTTVDFYPNRPSFHLLPLDTAAPVEVQCRHMKALFFVKSLEGAGLPRQVGFPLGQNAAQGKKIALRFRDGELLCGYSLTFVQGREGFFMNPAASDSNNLRIYVVNAATQEVRVGVDAESFVLRVVAERGAPVRA